MISKRLAKSLKKRTDTGLAYRIKDLDAKIAEARATIEALEEERSAAREEQMKRFEALLERAAESAPRFVRVVITRNLGARVICPAVGTVGIVQPNRGDTWVWVKFMKPFVDMEGCEWGVSPADVNDPDRNSYTVAMDPDMVTTVV